MHPRLSNTPKKILINYGANCRSFMYVNVFYLSSYIKLFSLPELWILNFKCARNYVWRKTYSLNPTPRSPKSILHISTWPRREDLWVNMFEGNLLKMFPFQVLTCLKLQRVDLIKRKVIISSVQWQYRWRLSYIMEDIVTSAIQRPRPVSWCQPSLGVLLYTLPAHCCSGV